MIEHIFIAGPYSSDPSRNTADAIGTANTLSGCGLFSFVPHLFHFWDFLHHRDYDFWMDQTIAWVGRCDAVLRLPGKSKGADMEVERAEELGLPVFYDTGALLRAVRKERQECAD